MVEDKLNGIEELPENDLGSRLRKFYAANITPEMSDLIVECDAHCQGDFSKLLRAYEDKIRVSPPGKYSDDLQRIKRLQQLQDGLKKRNIKTERGQEIDLFYLAHEFEPERDKFEAQRHDTGIIDKYLGNRYKTGTA